MCENRAAKEPFFCTVSAQRGIQFLSFFFTFFQKIFGERPLPPSAGEVCPVLGARSRQNPEGTFGKKQS